MDALAHYPIAVATPWLFWARRQTLEKGQDAMPAKWLSRPARSLTCALFSLILSSASAWAGCTVDASALSFGAYTGFTQDAESVVVILCNEGGSYEIQMDGGSVTGNILDRAMTNGGDLLEYQIYTDRNRRKIWGDGAEGSVVRGGGGPNQPQMHTGFGRLFGGQEVNAGLYSDLLVVTILF